MSEDGNRHARLKEEDINKIIKATEDLMQMGLTFSSNIESALKEFKNSFELSLKTHFMALGVSQMLATSFESLEHKINLNLEGINDICREGGQWYTYYLGTALGRVMPLPSVDENTEKSKGMAAS